MSQQLVDNWVIRWYVVILEVTSGDLDARNILKVKQLLKLPLPPLGLARKVQELWQKNVPKLGDGEMGRWNLVTITQGLKWGHGCCSRGIWGLGHGFSKAQQHVRRDTTWHLTFSRFSLNRVELGRDGRRISTDVDGLRGCNTCLKFFPISSSWNGGQRAWGRACRRTASTGAAWRKMFEILKCVQAFQPK